jgi:hypothetical protein
MAYIRLGQALDGTFSGRALFLDFFFEKIRSVVEGQI